MSLSQKGTFYTMKIKSRFALKRGVLLDLKISDFVWKRGVFLTQNPRKGVIFKPGYARGIRLGGVGFGETGPPHDVKLHKKYKIIPKDIRYFASAQQLIPAAFISTRFNACKYHCGLIMPYGDIGLGQLLGIWQSFEGNCTRNTSASVTKTNLKITYLKFQSTLPRANGSGNIYDSPNKGYHRL